MLLLKRSFTIRPAPAPAPRPRAPPMPAAPENGRPGTRQSLRQSLQRAASLLREARPGGRLGKTPKVAKGAPRPPKCWCSSHPPGLNRLCIPNPDVPRRPTRRVLFEAPARRSAGPALKPRAPLEVPPYHPEELEAALDTIVVDQTFIDIADIQHVFDAQHVFDIQHAFDAQHIVEI